MTDENENEEPSEEEQEHFDELHREKVANLEPVMQQAVEALEQIGIYALNLGIASSVDSVDVLENKSAKEIVESGEGQFVMMGQFRVGEVAWSDRVLDPEGKELKDELDSISGPEINKAMVEEASKRLKDKFKKEDDDADES